MYSDALLLPWLGGLGKILSSVRPCVYMLTSEQRSTDTSGFPCIPAWMYRSRSLDENYSSVLNNFLFISTRHKDGNLWDPYVLGGHEIVPHVGDMHDMFLSDERASTAASPYDER